MTLDRFRYLPCALHPALARPSWAMGHSVIDGPYRLPLAPLSQPDIKAIDLTHPAGWDHAVRAYVVISGVTVPESTCCRFAWTDAAEGWSVEVEYGEDVPGRMVDLTNHNDWTTPTGRREALCRCICAALNLDPDVVFPEAKS